jgi:hypothetical protein
MKQGNIMNHSSKNQLLLRTAFAAVILIAMSAQSLATVTLETKVTDTETATWSPTTPPSGAVNGTAPTTTSRDYKKTGNPTPVTPLTLNVSGTGATSYGYASVSDSISNNVATKTNAPTVVLKPGYPVAKTTAYSDPVGPLTLQITPASGPANQIVPMQFFLPLPNSSDVDHANNDDFVGHSLLNAGEFPSQGIYFDNGGLTPTQINGTLDAVYTLHAHVSQPGVIDTDLFNGSLTFHNGQNPVVVPSGDFANGVFSTDVLPAGQGFLTVLKGQDNSIVNFGVQANLPFDLTIDATMTVNDENGPNFTAGTAANFVRPAGTMGLFTAAASPVNRIDFTMSVVPEPASFVLAGLAAIGLAGYRCRRSR